MEPTVENFGKLMQVYAGRLNSMTTQHRTQDWQNFVNRTVNTAYVYCTAYLYLDAVTRSMMALQNTDEHVGYQKWLRIIQEFDAQQ